MKTALKNLMKLLRMKHRELDTPVETKERMRNIMDKVGPPLSPKSKSNKKEQ
jgi:hypothetical protein